MKISILIMIFGEIRKFIQLTINNIKLLARFIITYANINEPCQRGKVYLIYGNFMRLLTS